MKRFLNVTIPPWWLDTDYNIIGGAPTPDGMLGTYVARVEPPTANDRHRYRAPGKQAPDNAKLLAAAPDLFVALEAFVEYCEACGPSVPVDLEWPFAQAKAAIEKVRGGGK